MIITVSGTYGSGKSTVSKILAKMLHLNHTYAGKIMREIALRRGTTLVGLQEQAKTDKSIDKEVDARQIEIGKKEDNYVVEGHLAYHFIPNAIKIFITVDEHVGAKRILNDKTEIRKSETYNNTVDSTLEFMKKRKELTRERWLEVYGTDFTDPKNHDFVVDSTNISAQEVVQKIIDFLQKKTKLANK
jgi:cytidylate kinase